MTKQSFHDQVEEHGALYFRHVFVQDVYALVQSEEHNVLKNQLQSKYKRKIKIIMLRNSIINYHQCKLQMTRMKNITGKY